MSELIPVPFYDDTMVLVDHGGQPFVAMKPIVENMGLDWKAQQVKLADKFSSTRVIITSVGEDGKNREMVCLPLRKIPAFLYSVNPGKIKPELREKIVRYQSECDDALWDYWTKGSAARPGAVQSDAEFIRLNGMATSLLTRLQRETDPESRRFVHEQLVGVSQKLGIQPPALEKIGHAALPDHESPLIEEFWEIFAILHLPASKLNHSRNKSVIAINMPQVRAAAAAAKLVMPDIAEMRRVLKHSRSPRFMEVKAVSSIHTRSTVKCWVFEAETVGE